VLDVGDGVFFVTSWAGVDRAVREPSLRAGSGVTESMSPVPGLDYDPTRLWLMALDGPAHDRARGLVRREFTARRVQALRPFVEARAARLVEDFLAAAGADSADFVASVAQRLPSDVIRELFAIEPGVWKTEVHARFASPEAVPEQLIGALAGFFDARLADASQGLLVALQRADERGDVLSPEEVVSNAVLLATAAIDTTTGLVANALLCLVRHPGVLARARGDRALVAAVVEETLRFEPPALSCSRHAAQPLELEGVRIPAGSHLLLSIGAANRDPARYPDPDRFDPDRDHTGLLTFGGGRHFCLGAALARLEARAVLEALLARLGDRTLHLEAPVAWRTDNPTVRVPSALRLRLEAAG
jgi:cytochrome P450